MAGFAFALRARGAVKMMALLQRVSSARVEVGTQVVGAIDAGLLVLLCAERGDTAACCDRMLAKILKLRIFSDAAGKMNHSLPDIDGSGRFGGLLLVSQFTLAADTSAGNRPGFGAAAPPDEGRRWFDYLVEQARRLHPVVQTGQFGADMQVHLVNDGPVTIPLRMLP
jgi:D-tyrosyl-tRNA(Tyr) deacylase